MNALSYIKRLKPQIMLVRTGEDSFTLSLHYNRMNAGVALHGHAIFDTDISEFDSYWREFDIRASKTDNFRVDVEISPENDEVPHYGKYRAVLYMVEDNTTNTSDHIEIPVTYEDQPYLSSILPDHIAQIAEAYDPDEYGPFAEIPMGFESLVLWHGSDDGKEFNEADPMILPFWVSDAEGLELNSFHSLPELLKYTHRLIQNPEEITGPALDS